MTGRLKSYIELSRPVHEFSFSRPLVIFQSDDWGLVGIKNKERHDRIIDKLSGSKNDSHLDAYAMENPEDLKALYEVLSSHKDSVGNNPVFVFNFIMANVDFEKVIKDNFRRLYFKPLHDGLPAPWEDSGINKAYREGIELGFIYPALHGVTHFHVKAVEKILAEAGERGELLRSLYRESIPLSYPHTPFVGFEYKDEGKVVTGDWLSYTEQLTAITQGKELFGKTFGKTPVSASAPGYRANSDTFRVWSETGVKVAQGGPGIHAKPFAGKYGLLYTHRNISFEPASDRECNIDYMLNHAQKILKTGCPVIFSTHSINFHSRIRNYRDKTLRLLDDLLYRLEDKFNDILYIHDKDLLDLVNGGHFIRNGKKVDSGVKHRLSLSPVFKHMLKQRFNGGMLCRKTKKN